MLDQPVPKFVLAATGGESISSDALKGKKFVLYFYPKDSTAGCTTEAKQFRELHDAFKKAGAVVLGVSRDSLKSHENFKAKQELPFALLSDTDETLCQQFGVIKTKTMCGRQVRGIERSTFLIDAGGVLRREWRGVKPDGHAAEVLKTVKTI